MSRWSDATHNWKRSRVLAAGAKGGMECPACGSTEEKEDNGDTREPTLLCLACGEQFDLEPEHDDDEQA